MELVATAWPFSGFFAEGKGEASIGVRCADGARGGSRPDDEKREHRRDRRAR
jgi:hypothetical protein